MFRDSLPEFTYWTPWPEWGVGVTICYAASGSQISWSSPEEKTCCAFCCLTFWKFQCLEQILNLRNWALNVSPCVCALHESPSYSTAQSFLRFLNYSLNTFENRILAQCVCLDTDYHRKANNSLLRPQWSKSENLFQIFCFQPSTRLLASNLQIEFWILV